MTCGIWFLIGAGGATVACIAGFIWLNRNKADQLDKAEGKVRDFKR